MPGLLLRVSHPSHHVAPHLAIQGRQRLNRSFRTTRAKSDGRRRAVILATGATALPTTTAVSLVSPFKATAHLPHTRIQWLQTKSIHTSPTVITDGFHRREYVRRECARKLQSVVTSNMFRAILGSLLNEDWTTPNIRELRITRDHRLLGRSLGEIDFKAFRCGEAGLIEDIHEIAAVARLDGDEVGYLLGEVEKIKSVE
jgi:hypothetical protein